jgi:hypothetical protein
MWKQKPKAANRKRKTELSNNHSESQQARLSPLDEAEGASKRLA